MVKINYRHCINNHCNKFNVHYERCMRVYSWYTHNGDKLVLVTLPVNTHHTHKGGVERILLPDRNTLTRVIKKYTSNSSLLSTCACLWQHWTWADICTGGRQNVFLSSWTMQSYPSPLIERQSVGPCSGSSPGAWSYCDTNTNPLTTPFS